VNPSRRVARAGPLSLMTGLMIGATGCGGDDPMERPTPLGRQSAIEYPLDLWDRGVEGSCLLRVRVTDLGFVDSVEVLESSGHAAFDSAAIQGALAMRFRPARLDGERIEVWAQVPVEFSRAAGR